jgi:hypothetical protein
MDTDKHGLKQDKRPLQQNRAASLMGELVCISEILFPIRVHLCPSVVKRFFHCLDASKWKLAFARGQFNLPA